MKRLSILITLLVLSVIQMTAQDTSVKGTITLFHQGKTADFAYNKMQAAIATAADGDTLYLSAGYFEGDFVLDKKLSFIGQGADISNETLTYYYGKIIVNIPGNTLLTARMFEAIFFGGSDFSFNSTIGNVVFKKCVWFNKFTFNAEISSMLIDRCRANMWYLNDYKIKKLIARNSELVMFYLCSLDGATVQCTNCNIDQNGGCADNDCTRRRGDLKGGTYTNCIIINRINDKYADYIGNIDETDVNMPTLTNCLFYTEDGIDVTKNCNTENCYTVTQSNGIDIEYLTKEELEANNYLGTDGTVVGYLGGKNPYSLRVSQPSISSSKVHFDKDNKQIRIKMKVSSEQ